MTAEPAKPPLRALVGLVFTVALLAVVWLLMRELQKSARLQDCMDSGRTNCMPIDSRPGR